MLKQVPKRYYRPESEVELISLTRYEKVYTKVVETPVEGAADVAADIAALITRSVKEKGRCVIGFGAGGCALDIYDALVKLYFADKVSFSGVVAFNIAELGFGEMADDAHSTFRRLQDRLFSKVDIEPQNIHTFDRSATKDNVHRLCKQYETLIDECGGLDLIVCELTKNGGLAFNESGSTSMSSCRLVALSDDTRRRIAESYQTDTVTATAVTLGVSNFLSARNVIAAAWGDGSSQAVFSTIEGNISELTPASFLQMHHNAKLVIDLEASDRLTRINYPWKVTSCEWDEKLTRRALVWLSEQTGKPVLKLTNKDYNDYGLSELLTARGSAYDVNIHIFNVLQHTITGWPGGKPNADDTYRPERAEPYPKRVLIFSPHPDDAVVSMGGTLRKLVLQGHEVHVCMMTWGDRAVNDEDLLRYIIYNKRVLQYHGDQYRPVVELIDDVERRLQSKQPGDNDDQDVRRLKGLISLCEGSMSCSYLGVPAANVHELSLPFYVENDFGQGRVTEADVRPVMELIQQIKPHQVFFAADLGDPFGTHERSANAVLAAVDELRDSEAMRQCRVWMYRGQWGTWDIDNIEMAVPMSPEEFSFKRRAILKHQSQVHDAPYRSPDDGMLSWQTSLERNLATAAQYSRLGLASYEAIEAFVQYKPQ